MVFPVSALANFTNEELLSLINPPWYAIQQLILSGNQTALMDCLLIFTLLYPYFIHIP